MVTVVHEKPKGRIWYTYYIAIHPPLHIHICIRLIGWVQLCESPRCRESHDCVWVLLQQNGGLWTKNGHHSCQESTDGKSESVHLALSLCLGLHHCLTVMLQARPPHFLSASLHPARALPRPPDPITRSLILAISVCYHARLQEREDYEKGVASQFVFPLRLPGGTAQFRNEIQWYCSLYETLFYSQTQPIPSWITFQHRTQGMKVWLVTWAVVTWIYKVLTISFIM